MTRSETCSGIYIITNKITGQFYGGSSTNIYKRWEYHKWMAKSGSTKCTKLYAAIRKYGVDNFSISVYKVVGVENLLIEEQLWLDQFFSESTYNILKVASAPMTGRTHSEETKRKIGSANKGKVSSMKGKKNEGKRLSMLGVPRSEEVRRRISLGHKGQIPWNKGIKTGPRRSKS